MTTDGVWGVVSKCDSRGLWDLSLDLHNDRLRRDGGSKTSP